MEPNLVPVEPIPELIQNPITSSPEPISEPTKKSLPKWPLVIVGVILLTTLLTGTYLLGKNQGINQKQAITTPAPTQTVTIPTPTAAPVNNSTATWKTFSNQSFSFKYPADWEVVATSQTLPNITVLPSSMAAALKADIVKNEDGACHPDYPINIYLEDQMLLQSGRFNNTDYQVVTKQATTVSGLPATHYYVNMNFAPCGFETGKSESITVENSGKTYSLDVIPSDISTYKQIFDTLIPTFKFTK